MHASCSGAPASLLVPGKATPMSSLSSAAPTRFARPYIITPQEVAHDPRARRRRGMQRSHGWSRWLLPALCAAGHLLADAVGEIITATLPNIPYTFVRALDYNETLGWRETHSVACTRVGMVATEYAPVLTSNATSPLIWTAELAGRIVAAFNRSDHVFVASNGCCAPGLWCSTAPSGITECTTHGEGAMVYVNAGWTLNNSAAPVFTCVPSTAGANASLTDFASQVPYAAQATILSSAPGAARVRIDGKNFGVRAQNLSVQINGVPCSSVDVCTNQCAYCQSNADCGDDKQCVTFDSYFGMRFCLRPCNVDRSCPCGGYCYEVSTSESLTGYSSYCLNTGATSRTVCATGDWKPTDPSLDSRIECTPARGATDPAIVAPMAGSSRRLDARIIAESHDDTHEPVASRLQPQVVHAHKVLRALSVVPATQRAELSKPEAGRILQDTSTSLLGYRTFSAPQPRGYRYRGMCAQWPANVTQVRSMGVVVARSGVASTGLSRELVDRNASSVPNSSTTFGGGGLIYNGFIPTLAVSWFDCTADVQCPVVDACSVPRCVAPPGQPVSSGGCCMYSPSGQCSSHQEMPRSLSGPVHTTYFALPREVAGTLPMPPVPVGAGQGVPADMANRRPEALPYGINWAPDNVWYRPTENAFPSNFTMSRARSVDDAPLAPVTLPFNVSFFGQTLSTLFVSPNGMLRVLPTAPCGGTFTRDACTLYNAYDGGILPLVTDFSPVDNIFTEIWTGVFSGSTASPEVPSMNGTASRASQSLCVTYQNLAQWQLFPRYLLPPNPGFNMHVCIFGDGAIRWRYGQVLGKPSFFPGSWSGSTVVGGWGGPPNATSWLAGVRAVGAGYRAEQNAVRFRQLYGSQLTSTVDLSLIRNNELMVSRRGVRQGGTVAMCSHSPIACAAPVCGPPGTVVRIQWQLPACGMGFDALGWTSSANAPRVACAFGDAVVVARLEVQDAARRQYVVTCTVPESTRAAASQNQTVLLSLRFLVPLAPDAFARSQDAVYVPANSSDASSRGIGFPAVGINVSENAAMIPLDVYGIRAFTVAYPAVTNDTLRTMQYLVPHPLMFTYSASGASCGCSAVAASAQCDTCGVCGGSGVYRDCAGVCFGTAFRDECGVCSAGTTGKIPDADKDCRGQCFGSDKTCGGSGDTGGEAATALTIIVIIALVACSVALFSMLGYFGYVAVARRRRSDLFVWDDFVLDPHAPRGLTAETIDAMPTIIFARDEVAKVDTSRNPDESQRCDTPAQLANDGVPTEGRTAQPTGAGGTSDTCAICLSEYEPGEQLRIMPPCNHRFHVECVRRWLMDNTQCPVCRADLRGPADLAIEAAYHQRLTPMPASTPVQVTSSATVVPTHNSGSPGTAPRSLLTSRQTPSRTGNSMRQGMTSAVVVRPRQDTPAAADALPRPPGMPRRPLSASAASPFTAPTEIEMSDLPGSARRSASGRVEYSNPTGRGGASPAAAVPRRPVGTPALGL